ncbi:hypothetical protein CCACVL1_04936 [Corchorus capsularis]|uniref:Uncharacterized protein n=1 Tax=Corchorus capsularis TaxID=210143 RepID=A0A1R3JNN4_COCAP|nr:hypothetical protein CCACVL1_04936 [Corchorus capsularis]
MDFLGQEPTRGGLEPTVDRLGRFLGRVSYKAPCTTPHLQN